MNAPFLPSRARGLIRRLEARQARIGMIGLGYAGFPLALRYAETGFRVTGFDIAQALVDDLLARRLGLATAAPLAQVCHF